MTNKEIIAKAKENLKEIFEQIDETAVFNQNKVLTAFQNNLVAGRHFAGTSGYGYDDTGRDTLAKVFAEVFGAEKAIVSPNITCGSHALTIGLFGLLRPKDTLLSIAGKPYDTLDETINGKNGEDNGSLKDYGVSYEQIDLLANGQLDIEKIKKFTKKHKPKVVFLQKSRGYSTRSAISCEKIKEVTEIIKSNSPKSFFVVDNCYGEFCEKIEPTNVGADVIIGSLIKNPGGGIAPTGAYIAGSETAINLIASRFVSPSLGLEVGSYENGYRLFYQGLFVAPSVVASALKGAYLVGESLALLGYNVLPSSQEKSYDIIKSICLNSENELVQFVQTIQKCSPVDSNVVPMPWDMPGYTDPVIMAAGTFVAGASIELSCDSPIKKPYIAYFQGGLTFEHNCIVAEKLLEMFNKN